MASDICIFCGGELRETTTDYRDTVKDCVTVIKHVPCEKCSQCGEEYFSDPVFRRMEKVLFPSQENPGKIVGSVVDFSRLHD